MDGDDEVTITIEDTYDGLALILDIGYLLYEEEWYKIDGVAVSIEPSSYITEKTVHITAERTVVET